MSDASVTPTVSRITVYPVKSLDPLERERVRVVDGGALAFDREYAILDAPADVDYDPDAASPSGDGDYVNGKRTDAVHRLRSSFDPARRSVTLEPPDGESRTFDLNERGPLNEWLSAYFERSVSVSVAHQFSPTVRQFPANRNPFTPYFSSNTLIPEQHIATAKLQFKIDDGPNRLYLTGEAGGPLSSNFFDNALRLSLEAARAVTFGPGRAQAAFRFGMGPDDLLPFKRFRLGAASREGRWQNDAFRSVAAAFNDPREEAHLFALNGTGPVAYLLSGIDNNSPGFRRNPLPSGPPLTRNIIEGRLSLSTRLPIDNSFLRPLRLEAFSGIGTFWNENDLYPTIRPPLQQSPSSSFGELIADAGLGARYDVSALDPLDFLTEQSDVLQDLSVVAQFPLWASELELTELPRRITNNGGQDEFAFRWLLGIQVNGR